MIQLRLFHASEPFQPIDQRTLSEGELVVGRDPAVDWMIPDEGCEISRRHCSIVVRDGAAILRDMSSNGVFIGEQRQRLARDIDHPLSAYETIHLGQFMIVVEPHGGGEESGPAGLEHLFRTTIEADAFTVRSEWAGDAAPTPANDHGPQQPALTDAALLEAFCTGAGLDPSSFLDDDPAAVMQRAGAMYKQMVIGLSDLLSERQALKSDLELERTTVSSSGNNPLKWAPTRRAAIDLLRERHDGFLSGVAALKASLEDLRRHTRCLMAGSRASVDHVLTSLAPQLVEAATKSTGGIRHNRAENCWRVFQERHADLADEDPTRPDASVNRAFRRGYERQLRQLEEAETKS
jgi:predicted component of type VI protein secretion system